jgi:DUF971 family protein
MLSAMQPVALKLVSEDRLQIVWSDGQTREYPVRELREKCPCATCRELRQAPPPADDGLTIITEAQTRPLRIVSMQPTGRYAYSIHFSDGHDTGIFTLESLREMGERVDAKD